MPERFSRRSVEVLENREIATGHFVTTLGDAQMAALSRPGQFFQVRLRNGAGPFLPRPFSMFDWYRDDSGSVAGFKILYKVVGEGTSRLSRLAVGDSVALTGPLGNEFEMPGEGRRVLMVAGGIGVAPFLALARACVESGVHGERMELLYGARTAGHLVALDEFRQLGVGVTAATDDDSGPRRASALALLEERLATFSGDDRPVVYAAGPTAMLEVLSRLCRRLELDAQVSLEARMICGFAVCNSCAVRVISPDSEQGWEYKLVCRDGPVFNACSLYVDR